MNKIEFKNKGETNAVPINADNLNLLQENVEAAIPTDLINVKGKLLKVGISQNQSISATTMTQINWDKPLDNNFDNDYEKYFRLIDGQIEVMNDNIKTVIVVASVQTNNTNNMNLYINKSDAGRYSVSNSNSLGCQATAIIPVSKGEKIYTQIYGQPAGAISNWTDMTFLEIVVI